MKKPQRKKVKNGLTMKEAKVDLFDANVFVFWGCKPLDVHAYVKKNLRVLPDHIPEWLKDNSWIPEIAALQPEVDLRPSMS